MTLKRYILENKETNQTIVAQQMIHVARKSFFVQINNEIKKFLGQNPNGILFIEKVQPDLGSSEGKQEIIKTRFFDYLGLALGLKNLSEKQNFMKLFSEVLGNDFCYQNDELYLKNVDKDRYQIVDLTMDNILSIIDIHNNQLNVNVEKLLIDTPRLNYFTLEKIVKNPILAKPISWVANKIYNFAFDKTDINVLASKTPLKYIPDILTTESIDEYKKFQNTFMNTIVQDRNEYIVSQIVKEENHNKPIMLTYGGVHLALRNKNENNVENTPPSILELLIDKHGFQLITIENC